MHREEENEGDTMFMLFNIQETSTNETWYLDSGCSNHMTGNKELFVNIEDSLKKEFYTGDDKRLTMHGIGDVFVKTRNGEKKIPNVYYVTGLKHNLLSVGQLLIKGHDIHFKN